MGSQIELNDTLQLTTEQGFLASLLDLAKHRATPVTLADIQGRVFEFSNKSKARLFHLDPVRVYLAHNIAGKWLFWGQALIQSLKIEKKLPENGHWGGEWLTSGTYLISAIYDPQYQETFTRKESPPGKSYFS